MLLSAVNMAGRTCCWTKSRTD